MAKIFTFIISITIILASLSLISSDIDDEPFSISRILTALGYHHLAMASSQACNPPWFHGPITIFAPADSSVRTCSSCSIPLLFEEHSIPGYYSYEYLKKLQNGATIDTIRPGRCLTVNSAVSSTSIFINGVEITRPNLYVSNRFIIHGVQGSISHLSDFSCSADKLLDSSTPASLTQMMIDDATIRLKTSGYNFLSNAMRAKYAELVTLNNMTIFAIDDSAIFNGGQAYVVNYHIIPNQILEFADLKNLPVSTVLPTLERGKVLTVTTPGGGGVEKPMTINSIKIRTPNLIENSKIVIHVVSSSFVKNEYDDVNMIGFLCIFIMFFLQMLSFYYHL